MSAIAPSESSATPVALTTEDFRQALERHLDETKPDPLARRQAESWSLEWQQGGSQQQHDDERKVNSTTGAASGRLEQRHGNRIMGRLLIQGDYVVVTLNATCTWNDEKNESCPSDMSTLSFDVSVTAQIRTSYPVLESNKEERVGAKLRTKMSRRLRQDHCIAGILQHSEKAKEEALLLCQARILTSAAPPQLEERVLIREHVAEGLARCLFSQHPDSVLAIVELVVSMPYLPSVGKSRLAQRAKLRLLEEAMVDACVKQEEDELLDELSLNEDDKKGNPEPSRLRPRHE